MANALPAINLPADFPFRDVFVRFAAEYRTTNSYWYVPKARSLSRDNVLFLKQVIEVLIDEFSTVKWDPDQQNRLLDILEGRGLVNPYIEEGMANPNDRAALARIIIVVLKHLGLAWVRDGASVVITDAGLDLATTEDVDTVITTQIAKIQYPNPTLHHTYRDLFHGLFPHVFLLQVLAQTDYRLSDDEFAIFVNLAQSQADLTSVVQYIEAWRELNDAQRDALKRELRQLPRWETLRNGRAYAIAEFAYPPYLAHEDGAVRVVDRETVDAVVAEAGTLKPITAKDEVDWFAYLGDPAQRPDWFTYLSRKITQAASGAAAVEVVEEHAVAAAAALTTEQKAGIAKTLREKEVEDFYTERLHLLEDGLTLVANGRQYTTPIGIMDLLCRDTGGEYVVVEIKADEAQDSVFGQILRYIGWVHLNLPDGNNNVRGIILASGFPETAKYSRIGLLRPDASTFLKFREHAFHPPAIA